MIQRTVGGKPIMLTELIKVLVDSLGAKGDCPVEAGCYMEGICGPPSIIRDNDGISFDFHGYEATEDMETLWGIDG